jgi:hypothetical protein
MLVCNRGQVIKFQYRKQLPNGIGLPVSSALYKGRIIKIIPTANGRDVLLEMHNAHIRRFHVRGMGVTKRVGIIERLIDWLNGTSYRLPIV